MPQQTLKKRASSGAAAPPMTKRKGAPKKREKVEGLRFDLKSTRKYNMTVEEKVRRARATCARGRD